MTFEHLLACIVILMAAPAVLRERAYKIVAAIIGGGAALWLVVDLLRVAGVVH